MTELEKILAYEIETRGPITFADFMRRALYEPGLGYYARGAFPAGFDGADFYTSPESHRLFGATLARQVEECWRIMGKPETFTVVEPGPGTGRLALDILDYLEGGELYPRLRYVLCEPFEPRRAAQRQLLKDHADGLSWVEALPELEPFEGAIVSNELLDAFPVHLVELGENGKLDSLKEIYVDVKEGGDGPVFFEKEGAPSTPELARWLERFSDPAELPAGYRTEVCLDLPLWLGQVGEVLRKGFLLTVDYGYWASDYYAPERSRGTLLSYSGHTAHERTLAMPGRQDITAHVNFSALDFYGRELAGLRAIGLCPQGTYLVSMGLDELIAELFEEAEDYEEQVRAVKKLIMPGTIGETHRVMLQARGVEGAEGAARGFTIRNQKRWL